MASVLARFATPTYSSSSCARFSIAFSSARVFASRRIAPNTLACVRTWRPIITFSSAERLAKSRMFWKVRAMPRSRDFVRA